MERPVVPAPPAAVRRAIARTVLDDARRADGDRSDVDARGAVIGTVTLRPHQQSAVARLRAAMREFGGALLADDTGLGKTYVAATLAREATRPLIVAPASLRSMWSDALRATDVRADLTSYSTLSRGGGPSGWFDLLVLDEAHHARTQSTRRYARLAELSRSAHVLLLSATPIHNSRRDLCALCALFLGARSWTMDDAELARCIVRRERHDVRDSALLPEASAPRSIEIGDDEELLQAILALPPPVPPSDGGDGGVLLVWSLVRQWASSHGALAAALRRRLARATALAAALESGRHPSRSELAAWSFADDTVQLAFPELVASTEPAFAADLLAAVRAHEDAIRTLLDRLRHARDLDAVRAEHLLAVRAAHPGEKIVAFTQYAGTVRALYDHLRGTPGVAALTGSGARVAGGALSRREAIARFAPRAAHAQMPPAAECIELLLATDVLSEGLNLQDASVVVHLDLPWTPARLEQRVGRSRRIGARHSRTSVYVFAPPAATDALLGVEARLREKLRAAGRVVGMAGDLLPSAADFRNATPMHERSGEAGQGTPDTSAARTIELLHQTLVRWRDVRGEREHRDSGTLPLVAAVRSERRGVLALLHHHGAPLLVAALDEECMTDAASTVLQATHAADGAELPVSEQELARALAMIDGWCVSREAALAIGHDAAGGAQSRQRAMRRIAAIAARTPHHRRASLAPIVARARQAAAAPYGVGAERDLDALVRADVGDEDWLRALAAFGAQYTASLDLPSSHTRPSLRALILLQSRSSGAPPRIR